MLPLLDRPPLASNADEAQPARTNRSSVAVSHDCGLALRLVETEGRPVRARLRCFRSPARARQRDLAGNTICELTTDGDAVLVDLSAFEIADIEVQFD
jgi:alpha-mannosidase